MMKMIVVAIAFVIVCVISNDAAAQFGISIPFKNGGGITIGSGGVGGYGGYGGYRGYNSYNSGYSQPYYGGGYRGYGGLAPSDFGGGSFYSNRGGYYQTAPIYSGGYSTHPRVIIQPSYGYPNYSHPSHHHHH